MKYLLPVFLVVILLGAGCTPSESEDPISVSALDGSSVTQQINEGVTYEDGIPVTEIVLGAQPDVTFEMEMGNFYLSPETLTVQAGEKIAITFVNISGSHTFVLEETNSYFNVNEGEILYFKAPAEPGNYKFYSDVSSDREMGMEGTLIVK